MTKLYIGNVNDVEANPVPFFIIILDRKVSNKERGAVRFDLMRSDPLGMSPLRSPVSR